MAEGLASVAGEKSAANGMELEVSTMLAGMAAEVGDPPAEVVLDDQVEIAAIRLNRYCFKRKSEQENGFGKHLDHAEFVDQGGGKASDQEKGFGKHLDHAEFVDQGDGKVFFQGRYYDNWYDRSRYRV